MLRGLCRAGWTVRAVVDAFHAVVPDSQLACGEGTYNVTVRTFPPALEYGLAAQYRGLWADALGDFDWFLVTEDDLAWRAGHFAHLVTGFAALAGSPYLPGLLRYEVRPSVGAHLRSRKMTNHPENIQ